MGTTTDPIAVFGAAGVTVSILLVILRTVYADLKSTRAKAEADKDAMLPALTTMIDAVKDFVEITNELKYQPPPSPPRSPTPRAPRRGDGG